MEKKKSNTSLINSIYLGDCQTFLRSIDDESVDLIVSSPPYNIGKEYETKKPLENYIREQTEVLKSCVRVLKKTGSIFWQVGSFVDDGTHIPLDVRLFPVLESLGMVPRNRIVWLRTHGLHAKNRFSCRHETILWFTKSEDYLFELDPIRVPQKYPNKTAWRGANKGELTGHPMGKNPGDVWAFNNVKHNHEEQTIHPCQFPEALVERIVLATTKAGNLVLDPYMGVGTVAVVAKNLDRNFLGAEVDSEYFAVANHRLRGEPDSTGNFPNLKTLRGYAKKNGLADTRNYRFTKQVGQVPTDASKAKIFPEHVHLERFEEVTATESDASAYRRGLTDKNGVVNPGKEKKS